MPPSDVKPPKTKPRLRFVEYLRAYLIAGLLVTGPISLTLYLIWTFVSWVDNSVALLIPAPYNPATHLPFAIPGVGLIVVLAGLVLIGALTAGYIGRVLVRVGERIVQRMPVIRGLYGATKQIFETVLSKQSNTFREAVLVEFPRPGMWSIGFITGRTEGELHDELGDMLSIYVPTTPNPTGGYLVFVARKDVRMLAMSVEDAIKYVVSTGIVLPAERPRPTVPPAGAPALVPADGDHPERA